jgi:hypothetical protein
VKLCHFGCCCCFSMFSRLTGAQALPVLNFSL